MNESGLALELTAAVGGSDNRVIRIRCCREALAGLLAAATVNLGGARPSSRVSKARLTFLMFGIVSQLLRTHTIDGELGLGGNPIMDS